jgi:hypothetical protein
MRKTILVAAVLIFGVAYAAGPLFEYDPPLKGYERLLANDDTDLAVSYITNYNAAGGDLCHTKFARRGYGNCGGNPWRMPGEQTNYYRCPTDGSVPTPHQSPFLIDLMHALVVPTRSPFSRHACVLA